MPYTVLVTAPGLAPAGLDLLHQRQCEVLFIEDISDTASLARMLERHPVDAVISRTMTLNAAMIASCPTLKVISKHGVGISNIDLQAATQQQVAVFSTPGANSRAVAEFSLGLMLACARHLARFDRRVRAGHWQRDGDGMELNGRTLGLVGLGQIARRVARVAEALGMRILAVDPGMTREMAAAEGVSLQPDLDTLLPQCDLLSLHCPAQLGAPPLLDAQRLAQLPRGAVIINTARGELIDEQALTEALLSGHIAAAGLDTFASEPLNASSPLRQFDNVLLTPHVAGSTPEALAEMARGAVDHALTWLDSLAEPGSVSPERLAALNACRCVLSDTTVNKVTSA